ncbi:MAG: hypothetical protein IJY24_05945, partial [Clostridia bacterium]|nr:hypothetical protein [Clostridia bacterium]
RSLELIDTDKLIEKKVGTDIPTIFRNMGEGYFRGIEQEIVNSCSPLNGKILATGGGVILNSDNIRALRSNGRIYFIDRPLRELLPTEDRPLSSTREDVEKRYAERYHIYLSSCDKRIEVDGSAKDVADKIIGDFFNENICD